MVQFEWRSSGKRDTHRLHKNAPLIDAFPPLYFAQIGCIWFYMTIACVFIVQQWSEANKYCCFLEKEIVAMPTLPAELFSLDIEPIEVLSPPAPPDIDLEQLIADNIGANRLLPLPVASSCSCGICDTCCCCGTPHPQ